MRIWKAIRTGCGIHRKVGRYCHFKSFYSPMLHIIVSIYNLNLQVISHEQVAHTSGVLVNLSLVEGTKNAWQEARTC